MRSGHRAVGIQRLEANVLRVSCQMPKVEEEKLDLLLFCDPRLLNEC